jgi:ATP-binding cassette subfamily C (CFTR/MRP) protein 1
LRLSASARRQATIGEMTNLIAVNAQTVCDLTTFLNTLWSAPLQIILAIWMLWSYLGVSALIGVATMVFFIPVNVTLGNIVKKLQTQKLKVTDSRIKMINEILSGMKVLKFYGWEDSFKNIVLNIRQKELDLYKKIGLYGVGTSLTWTLAPLVVSIVSFATFVLIDKDNVLDASTAFVSLSLFNILRFPMSMLPGVIASLINVSLL